MRILVILCLGFLMITACKTAQKNNLKEIATTARSNALIPYEIGNYWVYKYILHKKMGNHAPQPDTLRVLTHEETKEGVKVNLNTSKWMIKSNGDSVFVRCVGRGGGEFICPLYHRTATSATFSTCKGDVMFQGKVTKLDQPVVVEGKSYNNCYRYDITPQEIVYVSDGVGIIKMEYYDVDNKLMTERLLVHMKLK